METADIQIRPRKSTSEEVIDLKGHLRHDLTSRAPRLKHTVRTT